jgi:hypothetical protein
MPLPKTPFETGVAVTMRSTVETRLSTRANRCVSRTPLAPRAARSPRAGRPVPCHGALIASWAISVVRQ